MQHLKRAKTFSFSQLALREVAQKNRHCIT